MNENEIYKDAKKRVAEIRGFYGHVFVYVIVNLGLFIINILATPHHLWFYWPLLGWGIGLFAHGFSIFGLHGIFGKDWEERKIKEMMNKEKNKEK
ncbi:MAG: 2TM domain-containing protein [Candidatus Cloacimonetes bacterium]|nr:2TM domain-containing protein [Candidatus Cloacimonadota bacterium]MBL7085844.1 2TM domain-containing protein [Candidatus Cloacimonadota bacterium]